MIFTRKNEGTCSVSTTVTLDGDEILDIAFKNGCSGNSQGIANLCRGRNVDEVIALLDGTICGRKDTSCPDQLAKTLKEAKIHR